MKRHRIITSVLQTTGILLFGAGLCGCMETGFITYNAGLAAAATGTVVFTIGTMLRRGLVDKPQGN